MIGLWHSWFETREDALLTMRVRDLILRSIAKRCVSKDEATALKIVQPETIARTQRDRLPRSNGLVIISMPGCRNPSDIATLSA